MGPSAVIRAPLIVNIRADSPRAGEDLFSGESWHRLDAATLDTDERLLWRTLAGESEAWTSDTASQPIELPLGLRVYVIDHAEESQFEELRRLGHQLKPLTPLVCFAHTGQKFHGQHGRRWEALRGNLHLSAAFSPERLMRELGLGFSMLPAVAVLDCIEKVSAGALRPGIKWVNDILLEGKKIAGVISASQVRGERVEVAQVGIGLNVRQQPLVERDAFVPAAGYLGGHPDGKHLTIPQVAVALLKALAVRYQALVTQGPQELYERYCGRSLIINQAVRIWAEDHPPPAPSTHRGVVEAIEPDLALRLRGYREPVRRGRLAFEEVCLEQGL